MTFKELIAIKATEVKHAMVALLLTGAVERVSSFLLKRTERIAANSTRELIAWGFKRLFKKEKSNMFQKQYPLGDVGQVSLSESAGVVSISVSASHSAGGGSLEGVASASVSASIQLSAKQLIDAGFDLAAAKFPAAASLIAAAKAGVDSELAQ